jgi:hypothetical protein
MAGETVVLANLIINADGTVTGIAKAQAAVAGLRTETTRTVPQIESKFKEGFDRIGLSQKRLLDGFINIRQAVRGLFLGFSLGAGILALGNLITETIAASGWFQKAKAAASDWFHTIILGEPEATAALNRLSETAKKLGIRTQEAIRSEMVAVQNQINDTLKAMKGSMEPVMGVQKIVSRGGIVTERPFQMGEQLVAPTAMQLLEAGIDITKYQDKLNKLTDEYNGVVPAAKAVAESQDKVNKAFQGHFEGFDFYPDFFANMTTETERLYNAQSNYITVLQPEILSGMGEMADSLYEQELAAFRLTTAYSMLSSGVQAFAYTLVEMAASGDMSGKKMAAALLKAIAMEAAARGSFDIIEGISRIAKSYGTDPTGPALIGTGLKFLALAALLGAASGKLSGGSGGGGGGGGGRGSSAGITPESASPRTTSQPVYQITIDGGIWMGTREEIARLMAEINRESQRDNA